MEITKKEQRLVYVALRAADLYFGSNLPPGANELLSRIAGSLEGEELDICEDFAGSVAAEGPAEECCGVDETVDPEILGDLERAVDDELVVELNYVHPLEEFEERLSIRPLSLEMVGEVLFARSYVYRKRTVNMLAVHRITWVHRSFELRRVS